MNNMIDQLSAKSKQALRVAFIHVALLFIVIFCAIYIATFATNDTIMKWIPRAPSISVSEIVSEVPNTMSNLHTEVIEDNGVPLPVFKRVMHISGPQTKIELPHPIMGFEEIKELNAQAEKELAALEAQLNSIANKNAEIRRELDLKEFEANSVAEDARMQGIAFMLSMLRFVVIIVAFFLGRVLAGFARYHFLLSHHLAMAANALILTGPDPDDVDELAKLTELLSGNVSFGKPKRMPFRSIISSLSQTIAKSPAQ